MRVCSSDRYIRASHSRCGTSLPLHLSLRGSSAQQRGCAALTEDSDRTRMRRDGRGTTLRSLVVPMNSHLETGLYGLCLQTKRLSTSLAPLLIVSTSFACRPQLS